ncbi:hypothetical protein DFH28DRAFT_230387 [Melampsora americana]|nr:hypothetical protein DFH28DRAFT_230387 [Melampsora americana]
MYRFSLTKCHAPIYASFLCFLHFSTPQFKGIICLKVDPLGETLVVQIHLFNYHLFFFFSKVVIFYVLESNHIYLILNFFLLSTVTQLVRIELTDHM